MHLPNEFHGCFFEKTKYQFKRCHGFVNCGKGFTKCVDGIIMNMVQ